MAETHPRRRRQLFNVALFFPTILLLALALAIHFLAAAGSQSHAKALKLDDLRDTSRNLLLAMVDNETGQRGFIMTEKPEFLEPYNWSRQMVSPLLKKLDAEMPDAATRELVAKLHGSVEACLAFAAKAVELQQAGHHEESVALIATGKGKHLMDRVRQDAAALERALTERWDDVSVAYLKTVQSRETFSWAIIGADLLLIAGLLYFMKHFRRSQQMLHVCAWSKTVEYEGEWISFEEYLSRRFGMNISHGISPSELEKFTAEINQHTGGASSAVAGSPRTR